MPYVIVFIGAGAGGALRHAVNLLAVRLWGTAFPVGTLAVNILGSLVMAVLVEVFALRFELPQHVRLLLTTGLLGGFTTFSTFTLDLVSMMDRGDWPAALFYLIASVGGAVMAFACGMALIPYLGTIWP